jgi:Uma2 family endonuclease
MGAFDQLPPPLKRHRLTADQYQQLGAMGVLAPQTRVELINGEIIEMAPIGSRHWAMVNRIDLALKQAIGKRAVVSTQSSFRLDDHSEPEPDIGVFAWRDDFYSGALPTAAQTLLLVEVSDSTVRYDREVKLPMYAQRGIPELWIVDLDAKLFRVFRAPRGDDYLEAQATPSPGVVAIAALAGCAVDLGGLFDA